MNDSTLCSVPRQLTSFTVKTSPSTGQLNFVGLELQTYEKKEIHVIGKYIAMKEGLRTQVRILFVHDYS